MKNYTSVEQSQKLVRLGLAIDSADISYTGFATYANGRPVESPVLEVSMKKISEPRMSCGLTEYIDLPCWTVGALLNKMPDIIIDEDGDNQLGIYRNNEGWEIIYADQYNGNVVHIINTKTLIDAAFNMMVWLLENDYIQKDD